MSHSLLWALVGIFISRFSFRVMADQDYSNGYAAMGANAANMGGQGQGQKFSMSSQGTVSVFQMHPGLEDRLMVEIALIMKSKKAKAVLKSKLEILDGEKATDVTVGSDLFHIFRVLVIDIKLIFHCKVRHINYPYGFNVEKVLGPMEELDKATMAEFDVKDDATPAPA